MKSFWARNQSRFNNVPEKIRKWRWLILTAIGLSLLWVEILEFQTLRILNQPFHYFEVLQYAVMLIMTGVLVELFVRSNEAHKQAIKMLEYKHSLSLEFTSNENWDALTAKLAELPSRVIATDRSYFLLSNPIHGNLEVAGQWNPAGTTTQASWAPCAPCQICQTNMESGRTGINLHKFHGNEETCIYCLEIINSYLPTGIIRFSLPAGAKMNGEQEKVFNSIGDEIAIAIQTSHDRRRISEMQSAEVAMAERRQISTYVHDQLGQNLGYLHLKLDQLSMTDNIKSDKALETDIIGLREVANESYEIVRDILKKMQPEPVPHLTNLMHEHAKSISKRAGFTLDFKSVGNPISLLPEAQQIIFFAVREMLSNIEKHAKATRVEVLIVWDDGTLDISVTDNGRGFDMNEVHGEGHFGLGILQERAANLDGRMTISSQMDSGTVVSMCVPLDRVSVVPA